MKRAFLFLAFIAVFASCKKDKQNENQNTVSPEEQARIDDETIRTYLTAKNITATKDTSGLYYQVITPGTGRTPAANSVIEVRYVGTLIDGTVFDRTSSTNFVSALNGNLIEGWKIGIPKIKEGGRINLYIPSGLAYGENGAYNEQGAAIIPPNSVILFTVDLVRLRN